VFIQLLREGDEEISDYLPVQCPEDHGLTAEEIRKIVERDYCCPSCRGGIKVCASFTSDEPLNVQAGALKVDKKLIPVRIVNRRVGKIEARWICCTEGTPEKSYDDECLRHWDWQSISPAKRVKGIDT